MTVINKRLINYILIDKRHFGQIFIDFWSLEITEIKFEIRNQLQIKLISKSRTRFQQVSDPSGLNQILSYNKMRVLWCLVFISLFLFAIYFTMVEITTSSIALIDKSVPSLAASSDHSRALLSPNVHYTKHKI